MKNNINISALKKTLKKDDYICYSELENDVIFWNNRGYYAVKISTIEFENIKDKLYSKLKKVDSVPAVVDSAINTIIDNCITDTMFSYNQTNKQFRIFKNNDDFIPIDYKYYSIVADALLVKQYAKYSPIQFINGNSIIVIMPCRLDVMLQDIKYIFMGVIK